ncbi:MAG TPA: TlpA disulfide reductase family protein [Longimicrobiales bacterium]|nr:TlpA disulfide reductase family protein [Longimicrobiales bacterium]
MTTTRLSPLLFAALLAASPGTAQQVGLPLGSVPDAVQVEDLEGTAVDLGTIMGKKPVLVEFWATWCPLCGALEPRLHAARDRFGDRVEFGIMAVGVNQTPRRIRRHLEEHPAPGRMLFDARGRASRAFAAPTTSYIVVLDGQGRVVYTGVGEDQDIEAAVRKALAP